MAVGKWAWYVVKGAGGAHRLRESFRCAAVNFSAHTSRAHPWLGFRCAKDGPEPPEVGAREAMPQVIAPAPAPCDGPDEERFGQEPIRIKQAGGARAVLQVPYLPAATFSLFVPEQSGAKGVPLSWGGGHPKIVWQTDQDGTAASYQITFPERAVQTVLLKAGMDNVEFTISIRNLTSKTFVGVSTNSCFNNSSAPYFEDMERLRTFVWTDTGATCAIRMPIGGPGEPLHGGWDVAGADEPATPDNGKVRHSLIAIVSRDGRWCIAQAYGQGTSVANNAHYSCLHSRPVWPDIPPGEERSARGRLYFTKGGTQELFRRWQTDFGRP